MKPSSHAEMHEGQDALDRFRKAIKAIVSVPKSALPDRKKSPTKKKKVSK